MSEHPGVPPAPMSPLVDVRQIEIVDWDVAGVLRRKSGLERLRLAHEAWELARDRLATSLRARHPELSQEEIQRHVAQRLAYESS